MISSIVSVDANVVTILAFVILSLGAILGPLFSSRRTVRKVNSANGASAKAQLDVDKYKDYNLYDLCLQSLVNSEEAKKDAEAAAHIASLAKLDVAKIVKHLGIEE